MAKLSFCKYYLLWISFFCTCKQDNHKPTQPDSRKLKIHGKTVLLKDLQPPKVIKVKAPTSQILGDAPIQYIQENIKKLNSQSFEIKTKIQTRKIKSKHITKLTYNVVKAFLPEVISAGVPIKREINPKNIITYGTNQGLKNQNVEAIRQDKLGNLWFVTGFGGLCKFDGNNFYHYTIKQGLLSNNVEGLFIDSKDNKWIGTYNGITKFDGAYLYHLSQQEGLLNNIAFYATEDKEGGIWIGTRQGISFLDEKNNLIYNVTKEDGLADNVILSMSSDHNGNIWVGTKNGGLSIISKLSKFNDYEFEITNISKVEGLPVNTINCIYEDKKDNIWVGTTNGLVKLKASFLQDTHKILKYYSFKSGLSSDLILEISENDKDEIFLATMGGLDIIHQSPVEYLNSIKVEDGLITDQILSLCVDKGQNVWLGLNGEGLSKYNMNNVLHLNTNFKEIISASGIAEDLEGNLWISTLNAGLIKYCLPSNGKLAQYQIFNKNHGLLNNEIHTLHLDRDGLLWLGYYSKGLSCINLKSIASNPIINNYKSSGGITNINISSLYKDKKGSLWIGANQYNQKGTAGVYHLSNDTLVYYNEKHGLIDDEVLNLSEDNAGRIWIGSWGKGLSVYDSEIKNGGERFIHFNNKNAFIDDIVRSIYNDKDGNIWVGGAGNYGITQFCNTKNDIDSVIHYSTRDGLSHDNTYAIMEDANGKMWFGNRSGISTLSAEQRKTQGPIMFDAFSAQHSYPEMDFTCNTILEAHNQKLWLVCYEGIKCIDPTSLNQDTTIPNLEISNLKLFNQTIDWSAKDELKLQTGENLKNIHYKDIYPQYNVPKDLVLPYNINFIGFQFFGNNISNPSIMQYQYKLEGFDAKWSLPSHVSETYYSKLSPGKYIFQVRVRNGNGKWSESRNYLFYIRSPWWASWFAILIYVVFISLIIYMLINLRVNIERKRIKELESLRIKISSDLHDDVGTLLSGLAMQSQMLSITSSQEKKKELLEISDMSREAMDKMRDTVWAIDSRKDKVENLLDRMRSYAEKNLANKKMTHDFNFQIDDFQKFIDPIKRQNIYLIFKEAITNIVKHSNGSHVDIFFQHEKNKILLSVRDNGSIHNPPKSDSSGLNNMRMRTANIGGHIHFNFENGYKVLLTL